MQASPADVIRQWLETRLSPDAREWLDATIANAASLGPAQLDRALALAARRVGSGDLAVSAAEQAEAEAARPGWDAAGWTREGAARILILLAHTNDGEAFGEAFQQLCQTADLNELVALYRGLPLYPTSEALDWQIGEGLRTSIQAVFEAIAHRNPLPAERFAEQRWNHMVLKALFIGSTLQPIVGLDQRRNAELAGMLVDHVHERRAAGRPVDLQVWRCIAPFAIGDRLGDIVPLMRSGNAAERMAAALFLGESPDPAAPRLAMKLGVEHEQLRRGAVTWATLAA